MSTTEELDNFFESFQSLPGLIRRLAISVAVAQTELDRNYVESLAEFSRMIAGVLKESELEEMTVNQYKTLFQAIAPSRYQFSETVVEIRADLQASSEKSKEFGAEFGLKAGVFAVAVNASYASRSGSDVRGAAMIRTVLNAIPADPSLVDKFLARGGTPPSAQLPPYKNRQFESMEDSIKGVIAQGDDAGSDDGS